MNLASAIPDFDTPVLEHARKDFPLLDADMTVGEALERIRREGVGERVIYFYAIDEQKRLVGVVPTRRLLTAPLETALREIMVRRVVAVPAKATVLDACEFFVLYKFLAFPVVDEQRRVVGIIDANLFAEEILEAGETEDRSRSRGAVRPRLGKREICKARKTHKLRAPWPSPEQLRRAEPSPHAARFPMTRSATDGWAPHQRAASLHRSHKNKLLVHQRLRAESAPAPRQPSCRHPIAENPSAHARRQTRQNQEC